MSNRYFSSVNSFSEIIFLLIINSLKESDFSIKRRKEKDENQAEDVKEKKEIPEKQKTKEVKEKKELVEETEEDDLEEESESDDINTSTAVITYSLEEEQFLAEQFYGSTLDYEQLFNFASKKTAVYEGGEEQYSSSKIVHDTRSETMTNEEAERTMEDICYAQVLGAKHDVSYITRKRLANWVTFNPVLMRLFEVQNFTRDVNYAEF